MTPAAIHQAVLGERLRAIRRQQGLSLADVERKSGGAWKSVVVGAYERGDRAITVAKLARLTAFYGVPIRELLPGADDVTLMPEPAPVELPRVVVDMDSLPAGGPEPLAALTRLVTQIRARRDDRGGPVVTVREDDVRALARAFGRDASDLVLDLDRHGVLA